MGIKIKLMLNRCVQFIKDSYYIPAILLVIVFYYSNNIFGYLESLGAAIYFEPFILLEVFRNFYIFVFTFTLLGVFLFNWKGLSWQNIEEGTKLKWFIFTITLIIGWKYSTYTYNLYFLQGHYLDRILLICLTGLVLLHPCFILLFLVLSIVIVSQFNYPIGALSWTDKKILFDILILFNGFLVLKVLFRKMSSFTFILVAISMQASYYFIPAMAKIDLGNLSFDWIVYNEIHNLFVASYVHGWLEFFNEELICSIASILRPARLLIVILTVCAEFLMLFLLLKRRWYVGLVLICIMMHLLIFILSGIFFWKWILMNIVFLYLVKNLDLLQTKKLFNVQNFLISILIIIFSEHYFNPVRLAWFDSSLYSVYQIEAVGKSGKVYQMDNYVFAPYDIIFAQNRFYYLNKNPGFAHTFGSLQSLDLLKLIKKFGDANEIDRLKLLVRRRGYSQRKTQVFESFIKRYFFNLNQYGRKEIPILGWLKAPHHIYNNFVSLDEKYRFDERITHVQVRYLEKYYDGNRIKTLEDDLIFSTSID